MFEEIIVSGSGGQGVLLTGEVIAIAAIDKGYKATWLPSYGPEMRGGTANCSVVLSSEEIGSPMIEEPTIFLCFNQPSMNKMAGKVQKHGLIIANDDAITEYCEPNEVEIIKIKAQTIASEIGDVRTVNMVMMGVMLKKTDLYDLEAVYIALGKIWGAKKAEKLWPINKKAIQAGMDAVQF